METAKQEKQGQKPVSPVPLMEIATGFMRSKTLFAAVELELFTRISGTGADVADLGRLLSLDPRPAEMLLTACAALGLLVKRGARFYNSPLAEEYLVKGKPQYFGGRAMSLDRATYPAWRRLTEALKTNRAQEAPDQSTWTDALAANPERQRMFIESMHSRAVPEAPAIANAVDFSKFNQLLDVGGGSGAYCIELARRFPSLKVGLFDLPSALAIALEKIAEAGLTDRISTYRGDFFKDELPKGSDVLLLAHVLHDWGPDKDRLILGRCFAALPSGGTLILREAMMNDDKTGPLTAALMSLQMLNATEGRNYSWAEYTEWMEQAGFREIRRVELKTTGGSGLLIGRRP